MKALKERLKEKTISKADRFLRKRKAAKEDIEETPASSPPITRSQQVQLEPSINPQYRIVNWGHLCTQLQSCQHCDKGPLNLQNIVQEKGAGLGCISKIKCSECNEINEIRTDEIHGDENKRGPKRSKLNERCVLGIIHSGNGHQQLGHLLAPMDIHCLHSKSYKSIERRVGQQIERVTESSCSKWLEKEKETLDESQAALLFHMTWDGKREGMQEIQGPVRAQLLVEVPGR